MSQLTEIIRSLTVQDTKNLTEKVLKTGEEYGELIKKVLPYQLVDGSLHKLSTKSGILEECADMYLCLYSIVADLGFSDEAFEEMVLHKSKKWSKLQNINSDERFDALNIPFEIHITISVNESTDLDLFKMVCNKLGVKPIILDLQVASMQDVMTSSTVISNNRDIFNEVNRISAGLIEAGFNVTREKIETVPWHPAAPIEDADTMPPDCYFESHLNILATKETLSSLKSIALDFDAHLSRNTMKRFVDGSFKNMVTIRRYDCGSKTFEQLVESLKNKIIASGFTIDKEVIEFSIFDTKTSHDIEWLNSKNVK